MADTLMLYVLAKITTIEQEDLLKALVFAYSIMFYKQISFLSLGILWSHIALETGRTKYCRNYNLGNIRKTTNHLYTMYPCSEIIDGKEIYYYPPAPESQFNAYNSLSQACMEHLAFLSRDKYRVACDAMIEGRYLDYCKNLKDGGYFTASLERYQKTFLKLFDEYQNTYKSWYETNYLSQDKLSPLPFTT